MFERVLRVEAVLDLDVMVGECSREDSEARGAQWRRGLVKDLEGDDRPLRRAEGMDARLSHQVAAMEETAEARFVHGRTEGDAVLRTDEEDGAEGIGAITAAT